MPTRRTRLIRGLAAILVVLAAAGTGRAEDFGYTMAYTDEQDHVDGKQIATRVTVAAGGMLRSISAYIKGPPGQNLRLAVYADAGGEPGSLITQTDPMSPGLGTQPGPGSPGLYTMHWQTIPTPAVMLSPGTYWLAICTNHQNITIASDPAGGQTRQNPNNAVTNGFTGTWGASTASDTRRISIYATCGALFTDVSGSVGFDVTTTTGADRPSGVRFADVDNDGDLDAIITGDDPARLMINNDAGSSFTATTFGGGDVRGQGALLDADNDGDVDFFSAGIGGAGQVGLFLNDGAGAFGPPDDAGFTDPSGATGVAAADVDGDGRCDVLVLAANGNWFGLNRANPVTLAADAPAGLNDPADIGAGGFCAGADVNDDGFADFFCRYGGGRLFLSNSDGTYTQDARGISMATEPSDASGSAWGDYDNDGDLDLYCARSTSGQTGCLWRNDGGSFTDVTSAAGITDASGQRSACWGDYDNDGYQDLYVVTSGSAPNVLYHNNGDGTFTPADEGVAASGDGHDAAFVDYDNDGDLDLAVTRAGGTARLFRNNTDNADYLKVRVIGFGVGGTNKAAIGTRVDLYAADGTTLLARRDVGGARGYGGEGPLWLHFGGVTNSATYVVKVRFRYAVQAVTVAPASVSTTIGSRTIPQMVTIVEQYAPPSVSSWTEVEP